MISICIPTLNRYDCLAKLIESAERGEVIPDKYYVIDNGGLLTSIHPKVEILHFGRNIGVASSWNWFIKNVPEERIISNDDLLFHQDTVKELVNSTGDFVYCNGVSRLNIYSLFLIRNSCVEKVGYFDEKISPDYGYYEDNDYARRLLLANVNPTGAYCDATHLGSQTLSAFSEAQKKEHNRRFDLAKENYKRKWGGEPGKETRTEPICL